MWIERLMAGISHQHVLSYNPDFVTVGSIEEVMNIKLFDNKSLTDMVDNIEELEM